MIFYLIDFVMGKVDFIDDHNRLPKVKSIAGWDELMKNSVSGQKIKTMVATEILKALRNGTPRS